MTRRAGRPRVIVNCVADRYAATSPMHERIVEFSGKNGGGLIALRDHPDGTLQVAVYAQDATVQVTVGKVSQ